MTNGAMRDIIQAYCFTQNRGIILVPKGTNTNPTMKTPTEKETAKTIKNIRKATVAYIHILRKASKSMWFPDIKTTTTVAETQVECMNAIDEANEKFLK